MRKIRSIDHLALNAVNLEQEIAFFVDFIGMKLLQRWDTPKQAYVGFNTSFVIGIIENPSFLFSLHKQWLTLPSAFQKRIFPSG